MTVLLTPGPVEVAREVLDAERYLAGHRSGEFREIVSNCREALVSLSKGEYAAVTTGSGTLAVESMIYSYLRKGETVLSVSYGEFGNRFRESLRRRGCNVISLDKNTDDPLSFDEISVILDQNPSVTAVAFIHNETGNGTAINNLIDVSGKCKAMGLKVMVDSVSGFGLLPISLAGTGIDIFATCGHKGIASTPGVGIVAIGKGCYGEFADTDVPAYLDLKKSVHFMEKDETPYTPSVGSFNALSVALRILKEESIESRIQKTSDLASYVRNELKLNGYAVVGSDDTYSNSVINFRVSRNARQVVAELKNLGYLVAHGMGSLSESSIRIGIMGIADREILDRFLESLYSVDHA